MGNFCSSKVAQYASDVGCICCFEEERRPDIHDERYDVNFASESRDTLQPQPKMGFFDKLYPSTQEQKPKFIRQHKSMTSEASSICSPRGADFEPTVLGCRLGETEHGATISKQGESFSKANKQKRAAANCVSSLSSPQSNDIVLPNGLSPVSAKGMRTEAAEREVSMPLPFSSPVAELDDSPMSFKFATSDMS